MVTDIGDLYLKNSSYASILSSGLGSSSGASGKAAANTNASSGASSFQEALLSASAAQAASSSAAALPPAPTQSADTRPLGAAANSLSSDPSHSASHKQVVDRKSPLYEQCRALESFVVKAMLDGMRKTVDKSDLMGGGFAGDMYEDMLYDNYAETLTDNGGFGLADQVYLELSGQRVTA